MTSETAERPMRIGQLAERVGVSPRTIRYYERIGVLPEPRRGRAGYRAYDSDDLERLAFVRRAQHFGLRLDEIREVLALLDRGDRPCPYVLDVVRREVADLDRRLVELQAAREQLTALLARADTLPAARAGRYCELLEHRDADDEALTRTEKWSSTRS